jgi:hypothetical protein
LHNKKWFLINKNELLLLDQMYNVENIKTSEMKKGDSLKPPFILLLRGQETLKSCSPALLFTSP